MKNAVGFYFIVLYLFFDFLFVFNKKALHYCESTVEVFWVLLVVEARGVGKMSCLVYSVCIFYWSIEN